MNYKKLPSAFAIAISLELIMSPLPAMANGTGAQKALGVLNAGLGAYNQMRGNPMGGNQTADDMARLNAQRTPVPDKFFTAANMQKIPGLMEYIANNNQRAGATGSKMINPMSLDCKTLPTTLTEANPQVCRDQSVSKMADPMTQQNQAREAMAYYEQYFQINKQYENYQSKSNVGGQGYGVGCMEDAMDVLNGFFAYRVEQLDNVMKEMEKAVHDFETASETDLKAIRESTAILGGEDSKFATEFKNTSIFNYADRFADAGCNSIMSKEDANKAGKKDGLLGIEKKLSETFSTVPEGSKYSPESYIKNHADVVDDIKKMANKASEQATLNFSQMASSPAGYSSFLNELSSSVSSESGVNAGLNRAFFSDLQTKFQKSQKQLNDKANVIKSEMGERSKGVLEMLSDTNNDSSFEAEVVTLENQMKGECLSRTGIDTALSRIYDPKLSKQANKHTAEQLRRRLKTILADNKLSPARKLAELKQIEGKNKGRYEVKMDADYEIQSLGSDGKVKSKKVSAAGKVSPTTFFADVIQNCETQFQINKLNNKLSGKETIKQLRTLKQEYAKASRQHAKDIKDEIVKKMVDCNGNAAVASSSTVGSCSPARLNMSSPSFCAKAAFSCSQNMKQCSDKTTKFVKELKDDRLVRTNNYNNNVENLRKKLVGTFDHALSKFSHESEALRGAFGVGFVPPTGVEREIKGDRIFDQDFLGNSGDALRIKNPAEYLTMVKANLEKLKTSITDQQEKIYGPGGALKKHIAKTESNYKAIKGPATAIMNQCLAAYNNYNSMLADQAKQTNESMSELGEKTALFCDEYSDIMEDQVAPNCDDLVGNLSSDVIKAASKIGNREVVEHTKIFKREARIHCANKNKGKIKDKEGNVEITAGAACAEARMSKTDDLKNRIAAATGKDNACDFIESTECKPTPQQTTSGATVSVPGCPRIEEAIIQAYRTYSPGLLASSDDGLYEPPSTPVTGSFCNASNNSGHYNPKADMGGQGPTGIIPPGALGGASATGY